MGNKNMRNNINRVLIISLSLIIIFIIGMDFLLLKNKSFTNVITGLQKETNNNNIKPEVSKNIVFPDTQIYFSEDDVIWKYNPKTDLKENVAVGSTLSLSPDNKKLAYTFLKEPDSTNIGGVEILNLEDNSKEVLIPEQEGGFFFRRLTWSPSGRYLVVERGTGPGGGGELYDTSSLEKIPVSPFSCLPNYYWIDDNGIVFNYPVQLDRPWEAGYGTGIAIINTKDGSINRIKEPNSVEDYYIKGFVFPDKIYFRMEKVPNPKGWSDNDKRQTTYWIYDLTKNSFELTEEAFIPDNMLKKRIEEIFNSNIADKDRVDFGDRNYIQSAQLLKNDENWVAFLLIKDYRSAGLYIINFDIPGSLLKISDTSDEFSWPASKKTF